MQNIEEFLIAISPKVRRTVALYRIPPQDAEDVIQQAYLALVPEMDNIRNPEAWLLGTLRNKCLLYWRGRRRQLHEAMDTEILEWVAGTDASLGQERRELLRDLKEMIERLPERCREILVLRYLLDYDLPDVADRLGYQPSSISKVSNRCLAALERQMKIRGFTPVRSQAGPGQPPAPH